MRSTRAKARSFAAVDARLSELPVERRPIRVFPSGLVPLETLRCYVGIKPQWHWEAVLVAAHLLCPNVAFVPPHAECVCTFPPKNICVGFSVVERNPRNIIVRRHREAVAVSDDVSLGFVDLWKCVLGPRIGAPILLRLKLSSNNKPGYLMVPISPVI